MIQQIQVGGKWTGDRYKDDECVGRESVVWILCCGSCLCLQMARKSNTETAVQQYAVKYIN
jgi:hypothetical protein